MDDNWRKSSFSGAGNDCVEVALTRDVALVRDTKYRAAGQLTLPSGALRALLVRVA